MALASARPILPPSLNRPFRGASKWQSPAHRLAYSRVATRWLAGRSGNALPDGPAGLQRHEPRRFTLAGSLLPKIGEGVEKRESKRCCRVVHRNLGEEPMKGISDGSKGSPGISKRWLNALTMAGSHGSAEPPNTSAASIKSASQTVLGSALGTVRPMKLHPLPRLPRASGKTAAIPNGEP
jgi:hypothetical protein